MRHGWGTTNESSTWLTNGDYYFDHANCDKGAVVMYALGAPVSILWGSVYYPQMAGSWVRNVVVPEKNLNASWDSTSVSAHQDFGVCAGLITTVGRGLTSSTTRSDATGSFSLSTGDIWQRTVTSYRTRPEAPIFRIRDSFQGTWVNDAKIFSLNLMAQGAVDTPSGAVTPTLGTSDVPSVAPVMTLSPGVTRVGFHGQWGVDFDVYVLSDISQSAYIGNWGHNWAPGLEANEYQAATGTPFEERQDILRVRGTAPFDVLVIPYKTGQRPPDLAVTRSSSGVIVTMGGQTQTLEL
jgi:hypothetical protein